MEGNTAKQKVIFSEMYDPSFHVPFSTASLADTKLLTAY
jgi:hypothetical protein